jgi:hypothetical protein
MNCLAVRICFSKSFLNKLIILIIARPIAALQLFSVFFSELRDRHCIAVGVPLPGTLRSPEKIGMKSRLMANGTATSRGTLRRNAFTNDRLENHPDQADWKCTDERIGP